MLWGRSFVVWFLLGLPGVSAESLVVSGVVIGSTPSRLGYNLGHFMPDSNAADWFRYSGANAARVFISPSDIEPSDDIAPFGDGVASESGFFDRIELLRSNASSAGESLNSSYVNWTYFSNNYSKTATGNNRIQLSSALTTLGGQGVAILANLTASPSRFPIASDADWAGKWELWQHYYAHAFILSRDYGVADFSMFNEPNGWVGMTEADWLVRHRICSDAIQSAISDMNTRYGRNLVAQVHAPNTANGSEKYNRIGIDESSTDTWGRDAIANRHQRLDGTVSPAWMNLQVYSYQKYTTRQYAANGLSGYINDYDELRSLIDGDMLGEASLPIALTEFNVRTGANYDTMTATQDSPLDFTALGSNCVALAERGIRDLYLFKFGQTANSASVYGIAKNGSHYVENAAGSSYSYGGATQSAEVYRLFNKAAIGGRSRLEVSTSSGLAPKVNAGVWSMATHDPQRDVYYVFMANQDVGSVPVEFDFSALPVAADNPIHVEEVSARFRGGVSAIRRLSAGKAPELLMPGQSVWLVSLPAKAIISKTETAVADTQLSDGLAKNLGGGAVSRMEVRADGSVDGRKVSLIQIPIPAQDPAKVRSVILTLNAATTSGTDPIRAHVYGVVDLTWQESSASWGTSSVVLKQNVAAGNLIRNNVVAGQGLRTMMLGQLLVDSPVAAEVSLDVSEFVKSQTGGFASFMIVQDHRWDIAQPDLTVGDTQSAGIFIDSRESGYAPRLVSLSLDSPPVITMPLVSQIVEAGDTVTFQVEASGADLLFYQWFQNGRLISGAVSSSYVIPSADASSGGDYQVVVSNTLGSSTRSSATLAVRGAARVAREATIRGGSYGDVDQDEIGLGYVSVRFSSVNNLRKAYLQFDMPESEVDPDAGGRFVIRFHQNFRQSVQLWGLKQAYPEFTREVTWNAAQANHLASHEMLLDGANRAEKIGGVVEISPGGSLNPYEFSIPRIGDFMFGNRVTFVLTGVSAASNADGGLRLSLNSATLGYALKSANSAPQLGPIPDQVIDEDTETELLEIALSDAESDADDLVLSVVSLNQTLVPDQNLSLAGSGGSRTLRVRPAANQSGTARIEIRAFDGVAETRVSFLLTVREDPPWKNWLQETLGSLWQDPALADPLADPDADGVVNMLEYALRGNPTQADVSILPLARRLGGDFEFSFVRAIGLTDLRMSVEVAGDLDGVWQLVASSSGGADFGDVLPGIEVTSVLEGGAEHLKLVDRRPGGLRRFVRLRVEWING